jgi:2'-5' RNA ligase
MDGVVSLLDPEHTERVARLWAELERAFGLRGVYRTPFPHFSYHVAPRYALERLEPALRDLAAAIPAFAVASTGLGVFPAPEPVVYIAVEPDPALAAIHRRVWEAVEPAATGSAAYYRPGAWVPHITLAAHDLRAEQALAVTRLLAGRDLRWRIPVDTLALIADDGARQELRLRLPLAASRPALWPPAPDPAPPS